MCPLTKHLSVAQQLLAQCEEHHQQEEQGHDLQEVEDRSLPEEGRQDLQDCMQCPEIICLRKTKLQAAQPQLEESHTLRGTLVTSSSLTKSRTLMVLWIIQVDPTTQSRHPYTTTA